MHAVRHHQSLHQIVLPGCPGQPAQKRHDTLDTSSPISFKTTQFAGRHNAASAYLIKTHDAQAIGVFICGSKYFWYAQVLSSLAILVQNLLAFCTTRAGDTLQHGILGGDKHKCLHTINSTFLRGMRKTTANACKQSQAHLPSTRSWRRGRGTWPCALCPPWSCQQSPASHSHTSHKCAALVPSMPPPPARHCHSALLSLVSHAHFQHRPTRIHEHVLASLDGRMATCMLSWMLPLHPLQHC